jgi:CheY-like chemotaxis protein
MLHLLYIEDHKQSRDVLTMIQRVNARTMSLTIFEDSARFLERVEELQIQPNIFLLDIHVQPYNGFEMLKMLQAHPIYQMCPTVALTASVMNEEITLLKQAGFSGVFAKPVDIDSFPAFLERIKNGERIWYVW